jgi:hypothetical protein
MRSLSERWPFNPRLCEESCLILLRHPDPQSAGYPGTHFEVAGPKASYLIRRV